MTFEQIITDLKNKIYKQVYFLMGEEPFFIDKITNYIQENVLTEAEKAFNFSVVYGKDTDIKDVINTACRFPMMSNYHLVILKEAQEIKNIDILNYYIQKPLKSTILVVNYKYKTLDKRKKLYKALDKNKDAVIFESKKMYDSQIPKWIESFLQQKGYSIDPKSTMLLAEYLGNDISKIVNELEKLTIVLPQSTKINADHIEKNIGISKDFNVFELQNAIANKDVLKANRIINYFAKNQKQHNIIPTISALFNFFTKILQYHFVKDKSQRNVAATIGVSPYFVKDYTLAARNYNAKKTVQTISFLREYDMKSKGVGNVSTEPGELLKELIFKIMH